MGEHRFDPIDTEKLLEKLGIEWKRQHHLLWFCCPWHQERTPSCRIFDRPEDRRHGQVRCYGCNEGGWPIHLVTHVAKLSWVEAKEWLKDVEKPLPLPFAIHIDPFKPAEKKKLELPPGFVHRQLEQWVSTPRRYLDERSIVDWQVIKWGVGYTPPKFDKQRNPYPGRIFIPVHTERGELVNYTGRTYLNSTRRYITAKTSDGASVTHVFGEYGWPEDRLKRKILLTEGAFDALTLERLYPHLPIGAFYGSEIHDHQVRRISKFGVGIFAKDHDKAGTKAAGRIINRLSRYMDIRVVDLPEDSDCNSMFRSDRERLKSMFDKAVVDD